MTKINEKEAGVGPFKKTPDFQQWQWSREVYFAEGCGGGQLVSVLAFYSDNPSSNPANAYSFFVKFVFEKNENRRRLAHLKKYILLNWS